MSFWNILCGAALLDMVCQWFSPKRKTTTDSWQHHYNPPVNPMYEARIKELEQEIKESEKRLAEYRKIIGSSPSDKIDYIEDIDELQDRIDELESRLDDCDVLSDRYDRIQDEIDMLQERLDERVEMEDDPDILVDDSYYMDSYHNDYDR